MSVFEVPPMKVGHRFFEEEILCPTNPQGCGRKSTVQVQLNGEWMCVYCFQEIARKMAEEEDLEFKKLTIAVKDFSDAMLAKLLFKAGDGFRGWNDSANAVEIAKKLKEHLKKLLDGDYSQAVDVANLTMMFWSWDRKETIEVFARAQTEKES